jgi:intracellular septation protein A
MKLPKRHWAIARTLLFVIIGLLNTVFIRPEDIGTWKNYLGYGFLLIAVIDIFFIIKKYYKRNANEK